MSGLCCRLTIPVTVRRTTVRSGNENRCPELSIADTVPGPTETVHDQGRSVDAHGEAPQEITLVRTGGRTGERVRSSPVFPVSGALMSHDASTKSTVGHKPRVPRACPAR